MCQAGVIASGYWSCSTEIVVGSAFKFTYRVFCNLKINANHLLFDLCLITGIFPYLDSLNGYVSMASSSNKQLFINSFLFISELLTKIQIERMFSFTAELCKKYNLSVTPDTVLTHYEFGKSHQNTSSVGKIDITILPPYLSVKPQQVGDFIRKKVKWYFNKISEL